MNKRLLEIMSRKVEIRKALESGENVDLQALKTELDSLNVEAAQIEERAQIIKGINVGTIVPEQIEKPKEERKTDLFNVHSVEYRSAFYKNLCAMEMTEVEKRAVVTGGSVVPTQTLNMIITKVRELTPMLSKIELYNVAGNITINIEDTINEAAIVAAGGTITESDDTLKYITLTAYEIKKLVRVPASMIATGIDAVETWVVNNVAESIARKINYYLILGTGSSQPTGLEKVATWEDTVNAVVVANGSTISYAEALELIGYAQEGQNEFYMKRATFFGDFLPLVDTQGNKLCTFIGDKAYILGYPVNFDSNVAAHVAYFGDVKRALVGNLSISNQVKTDYDITTDSYRYLGVGSFDSKVKDSAAVVKTYVAAL